MESKLKFSECLYFATNTLSRAITRMADEAFAVTGLSSSYAFLLMIVNEKPGISISGISEKMHLAPSTITRFVEKMEMKNLLERKTNGRISHVYPTQTCIDIDEMIKDAWSTLFNRYTSILGTVESEQLIEQIYRSAVRLE
jgi:DNA-binding MarR family transcriptional regulator